VAQMLQQKKLQQTNENDNEIEEIEINDSNSSAAVVVSASVRDIVDSVAKGEDQGNDDERNGSVGSSDAEDIKKDNSIPVVKLPDGLPPELSSTIDKIKKVFIFIFVTKYDF
jgi:predicted type IV restriction endonuclease